MPTTEVSLGFFGQFTPTRARTTDNTYVTPSVTYSYIWNSRQGPSSSAGVEATFHQQFRRYIGYKVNIGYSRFAEKYADVHTSGIPEPDQRQSVGTNFYELSTTAVIEGPRTRRFSTSAEMGPALLSFLPTLRPSETSMQLRPALAFGVGVNYKLNSRFSARVAYKGLFYENPDFRGTSFISEGHSFYTVTSEPTVSLVYTFGHRLPKALYPTY